jgi:hypothetical protein
MSRVLGFRDRCSDTCIGSTRCSHRMRATSTRPHLDDDQHRATGGPHRRILASTLELAYRLSQGNCRLTTGKAL